MKGLVLAKMLTTVEYMLVRKHLNATLDYTKHHQRRHKSVFDQTQPNPVTLPGNSERYP